MGVATPLLVAIAAVAAVGIARAADPERLYLGVFVNGYDRQLVVEVERRGDRLYTTLEELAAAGLLVGDLKPAADGRIAIDDLPGVRYEYRAAEQSLELSVASSRLVPDFLGYNTPSSTLPSSDKGLVFNYSATVQSQPIALEEHATRLLAPLVGTGFGRAPRDTSTDVQDGYDARNRTATLDADLRFFAPFGVFVDRGYVTQQDGESSSVRYETYWTYTQIDPMRTYTVGDFISSSLAWTRSVRLGGMRASRNFDVRPDLVTFPLPLFGGNAVVPTAVDLYVNGRRQFSGATDAGPFLVVDPPALTGAGEVSLVFRDATGQEIVTTRPLYVDSRLLNRGYSDYAFEIGYPRRHYGSLSSDYDGDPAVTASVRYGLNDLLTLEGHAENAQDLDNVGVGGLVAAGRFGVWSWSYSVSADSGARGQQTSAGYQYIAPHWSVDVYDRRTHDDFRDIGTLEGSPVPTKFSRAGFSVSFGAHTGLITYTEQEDPTFGGGRVVSAGYNSTWLRSHMTFIFTVFHDLELEDADGAYFGVSFNFGERHSAYSGVSHYGDDRTTSLGMSRPVDYDRGGIGWNVYAESGDDDYSRTVGRLDYRNRFGDWSALVEKSSDANTEDKVDTTLYGTGALVFMRRNLFATRAIYDGFALVSTGGSAGVPVLRENRLLGTTDRDGYLLVSDLPAYRASRLGIDPLELPIDVNVATIRADANPRAMSGVVVQFPLERYSGATLVLVDAEGDFLAPGLRATLAGRGESALIGYDGRVFFSALDPTNRVEVELDQGRCTAQAPFSAEDVMRTLGPFVCVASPP